MTDTVPIFFGGSRHIAGQFLRGAHNVGARSCAVLLCAPIGHEYMCSHGAFRRLSRDLATKHGVALHLIFSEGDASQIFFERSIAPQLGRLSLREDFTIDIVPGADHTFMPIRWQRALAELMTKRLLHHLATNSARIGPPLE